MIQNDPVPKPRRKVWAEPALLTDQEWGKLERIMQNEYGDIFARLKASNNAPTPAHELLGDKLSCGHGWVNYLLYGRMELKLVQFGDLGNKHRDRLLALARLGTETTNKDG